jgi:hypothetical protein
MDIKASCYVRTHEKKDGVQIYLFEHNNTKNRIDIKTSQYIGRYGVSKEKNNRAAN